MLELDFRDGGVVVLQDRASGRFRGWAVARYAALFLLFQVPQVFAGITPKFLALVLTI
jgi:hypothetical protein